MKQHQSLLKLALESQEPGIADKERTIVMNGPLSVIMAKALDVAYAKNDPVTGESTAAPETGAVVMETQAMDYAAALAAAGSTARAEGSNAIQSVKVFTYGVGEVKQDTPEPIEVVKELLTKDVPFEFVIVNRVSEDPNSFVNPSGFGWAKGRLEDTSVIEMGDVSQMYGNPTVESVSIVVNYKQTPTKG